MGTSASGSGPKGKTPLLPSWATSGGDSEGAGENQSQDSQNENVPDENNPKTSDANQNVANEVYTNGLQGAKSILKRISNKRSGSDFRKAAKSYVRSIGGHKNASRSSLPGIRTGGAYFDFWNGVSQNGFSETLLKYDLTDCIGKSTEEAFAKIADKIAPIGSTNDEAIARSAVMMAFERLCEKMIENDQDLDTLDRLDEDSLKETIIEFVSAYIFKKWVYEAGLALERNDLSEEDAIDLENSMRVFVKDEVKSSLGKTDILRLDLNEGKGKEIVKKIFDLAYSTLEK